MKTSVVRFFAGSGIRLAILSVLLIGMAGACQAQASAAAARPSAQAAVAPQAQPAAQYVQTAAPEKPAPRGTQEGIKVHGHWTIEVKNPDGTLVTHREFENSLVPNGGAMLLSALLARTAVTGSWTVLLADTAALNSNIGFLEPNSAAASGCPAVNTNPLGVQSCSPSLALVNNAFIGPTGLEPVLQTFTLGGSGTVPPGFPSAIGYVQTENYVCSSAIASIGPITPQDCLNPNGQGFNSPVQAFPTVFTARTLDGQNGDPAAVPVTAGQTVSVTVVISFQ